MIFAERVSTLHWLAGEARRKTSGSRTSRSSSCTAASATSSSRRSSSRFKQESSPDPGPGHRRRRLRGRQPAPAVPRAGPLRHPVEPDPDRAAQRPHRPLRPAAPPAHHHAAARPDDRPVRRRHPGPPAAGREGARGPQGARRQRLPDGHSTTSRPRRTRSARCSPVARRSTTSCAPSTRSQAGDGHRRPCWPGCSRWATPRSPTAARSTTVASDGVYADDLAFLRDALELAFETPGATRRRGGVVLAGAHRPRAGRVRAQQGPAAAARGAAAVLPHGAQGRRAARAGDDRRPRQAGARRRARRDVDVAVARGPLPVAAAPGLDWAADRALRALGRNQVFAVARPGRTRPSLLLHGTLTNARGQVVSSTYVVVAVPRPRRPRVRPAAAASPRCARRSASLRLQPGSGQHAACSTDADRPRQRTSPRPSSAARTVAGRRGRAVAAERDRTGWSGGTSGSTSGSDRGRRAGPAARDPRPGACRVEEERALVRTMLPDQRTVRPLLLVVPDPGKTGGES